MNEQADNGATGDEQRMYSLQRMYLKDVSFESPNSPEIFLGEWRPKINMNLASTSKRIDEELHEVVLTITVEARQDDKTAFLIELQQAGIFIAKGFKPDELHQILGLNCPQNLFPFAREAVASLTMNGGFPQVLLQPINFEALYRKNLEELQAGQA